MATNRGLSMNVLHPLLVSHEIYGKHFHTKKKPKIVLILLEMELSGNEAQEMYSKDNSDAITLSFV